MDKTVTTLFKSRNEGCYSRKLIVYINIAHTKGKKVKHPTWQILAFSSKTDLQELAWRVLGISTAFRKMWSNILACIIKWVETPGQFRKSCLPGKRYLHASHVTRMTQEEGFWETQFPICDSEDASQGAMPWWQNFNKTNQVLRTYVMCSQVSCCRCPLSILIVNHRINLALLT